MRNVLLKLEAVAALLSSIALWALPATTAEASFGDSIVVDDGSSADAVASADIGCLLQLRGPPAHPPGSFVPNDASTKAASPAVNLSLFSLNVSALDESDEVQGLRGDNTSRASTNETLASNSSKDLSDWLTKALRDDDRSAATHSAAAVGAGASVQAPPPVAAAPAHVEQWSQSRSAPAAAPQADALVTPTFAPGTDVAITIGLALLLLLALLVAYCLVACVSTQTTPPLQQSYAQRGHRLAGPGYGYGRSPEECLCDPCLRAALYCVAMARWLVALFFWLIAAAFALASGLCCCCCWPRPGRRAAQSGKDGGGALRGNERYESLQGISDRAAKLRAQGHLSEAEKLYRQIWHAQESSVGPGNAETLKSIGCLASVLEALGRLGEAEELYRREHAVSAIVHGTEHPLTLQSKANLERILDARRSGFT